MPQFDFFSFFNQVTFFLFIFFSFYFFISYFFLPKIALNIKFRKKYLILKTNTKKNLKLENINTKKIFLNFIKIINNYYETIINENIFNYNIFNKKILIKNSLIKFIYTTKIKEFFNKKYIFSKKYLIKNV
jgi:hypothetical protein